MLDLTDALVEPRRRLGFTDVLSAPAGAIATGQSALPELERLTPARVDSESSHRAALTPRHAHRSTRGQREPARRSTPARAAAANVDPSRGRDREPLPPVP